MAIVVVREPNQPGFLAPAPAFAFYDPPEIYAPAPEAYEQWRLAEIVPVHEGWFYHQPTRLLAQADSAEEALSLVAWERAAEGWHAESYRLAEAMWQRKRPWWLTW